jgi:L-alanine-DL-glutamate epimerase-like enolase superfamily enzyme
MSSYARLAQLPLTIEGYALEPLSLPTPNFTRHSTVVRLQGAGHEGVGEDVTYQEPAQRAFQEAGPVFDLAGSMTLDAFSHRLDACRLFEALPGDPKAPLLRRWAFESAALDLALRQAGQSLAEALERPLRPLRFVVSLGLGNPASMKPLERLWASAPGLGLKLDASPDWNEALIAELAATGKVTTVDLKGQYKGAFTGTAPDGDLYRRVAEGLPEALLEDPGWTPETKAALADHMDRVTYDAPMCSLSDLLQLDPEPRVVNVKPSRYGTLSELFRVYDYCEARGIGMYGGGQFELGPGRGQIQYLASLFHPDAANDVAPSVFNQAELPEALPSSPLAPAGSEVGFRWEG